MLVMMAGLPGSGKSTLAAALAQALPALILDKDKIRAALFPIQEIEYSTRQDDFVLEIMLRVARFYFTKDAARIVILDGRPFVHRYQVGVVTDFAQEIGQPLRLIVCTCPIDVAQARLARAALRSTHLAANRDFELYQRLRSIQEPFEFPHLEIDTSRDLGACLTECMAYIRGSSTKS
jgi:adenylylsulfate kinase